MPDTSGSDQVSVTLGSDQVSVTSGSDQVSVTSGSDQVSVTQGLIRYLSLQAVKADTTTQSLTHCLVAGDVPTKLCH